MSGSDDLLSVNVPPTRCSLPDGAMINAEITVTSYFNPEGKLKYGVYLGGSVNEAQAVGLMELAKRNIIEWYEDSTQEDEDDDG